MISTSFGSPFSSATIKKWSLGHSWNDYWSRGFEKVQNELTNSIRGLFQGCGSFWGLGSFQGLYRLRYTLAHVNLDKLWSCRLFSNPLKDSVIPNWIKQVSFNCHVKIPQHACNNPFRVWESYIFNTELYTYLYLVPSVWAFGTLSRGSASSGSFSGSLLCAPLSGLLPGRTADGACYYSKLNCYSWIHYYFYY